MKIIEQHLPPGQFFRQVFHKTNIVLHHTVSSTARSALTWWKMQPERIGTAYVIDKDGSIYEAFPPRFWAHHLGLKSPKNTQLNRQSIGIEIVNEGPLTVRNGSLRWNFGSGTPGAPFAGTYIKTPVWRGFDLWAQYTDEQYEALNELIPHLLERFGMTPSIVKNLDYDPEAPRKASIYTHGNVRQDKTDVSPAFDFSRITLPVPV